jgi:hypothetical protein
MKANGHSIPPTTALLQQELETLLDVVVERYGSTASVISEQQHMEWLQELQEKLANWMLNAGLWAKKTLGAKNFGGFRAQTHGFERPFRLLIRGNLMSSIFKQQGLAITVEVLARDRGYPSESATIGFQVGYDALPAFQWLLENWRRLFERLWETFEPEWEDNGYSVHSLKIEKNECREPRGRAVLPKLDYYLKRSVAEGDRIFSVHIPIARLPRKQFETAILVQFAAFDAVLSLCGKRPQPDLLMKHFLILESRLPLVRFRSRTALAKFKKPQGEVLP